MFYFSQSNVVQVKEVVPKKDKSIIRRDKRNSLSSGADKFSIVSDIKVGSKGGNSVFIRRSGSIVEGEEEEDEGGIKRFISTIGGSGGGGGDNGDEVTRSNTRSLFFAGMMLGKSNRGPSSSNKERVMPQGTTESPDEDVGTGEVPKQSGKKPPSSFMGLDTGETKPHFLDRKSMTAGSLFGKK